MRDLDGKVAVVTGAASGMGRAFAEIFAEQGMKVVLADVEKDALDTAVTELRRREFDVVGVVTDVRKAEALENTAREAVAAYGKVHVLCNNAGVVTDREMQGIASRNPSPMWEHPLKDWEWTFDVNWWGVVHGIRAFLPLMVAHGEEGHVVNTASMAGLVSVGELPIYAATKHAVVSLSESLYLQLRAMNAKIGVSVLCPGGVRTRIGMASRNRPADMWAEGEAPPDPAALQKRGEEFAQAAADAGMPPEQVAKIVLDGVRSDQFYLLTHPEWDRGVQRRMEAILQRKNPGGLTRE